MTGKCVVITPDGDATVHDWADDNDQIRELLGLTPEQSWEQVCGRNPAGSYFVEELSMVRDDAVHNGPADLAWCYTNGRLAPWPMYGTVLIAGPIEHEDITGLDDTLAETYRRAAGLWASAIAHDDGTCAKCGCYLSYVIGSRLNWMCRACFTDTGPIRATTPGATS